MYGENPHTVFYISWYYSAAAVFVKPGIAGVVILAVKLIGYKAQAFTETLEVNDFTGTKELDNIIYVGVIGKTENIIIGLSCLLLCRKVFAKVSYDIARRLNCCSRPRLAACGNGIYTRRVVNKILVKALSLNFINRQIACELINQRAHHLNVAELFRTDIGEQALELAPRHCKTLAEIAHRCTELTVRPAELEKVRKPLVMATGGLAFAGFVFGLIIVY